MHSRPGPHAAAFLLAALAGAPAQVPTPRDVLGHEPGERFTEHAAVVRYCQALAQAASDRVRLREYGRTPGGRPLLLLELSAPRHMAQRARTQDDLQQLVQGTADAAERIARMPAVAWLSFNVHGNEASSTEAALVLLHRLLTDAEDQKLLDDLLVVIDPCLNPDGRDRYVHWFEDVTGQNPDPDPDAVEHEEPWPGGRFNHYRFDLNRDWAFLSQPESQARIAQYLTLPAQVHVDFHEMGHDRTYFFFPAAQPVNKHVDPRVLRWQEEFGKGNAAAFDGRGWRYYTRESFDLFYPGYGDSWPSLMGAAGMTYEMAGHGRAGRAVQREDGQLLTLRDRLERHLLAARATLQTAARNRARLLTDFERQHRDAERLGREDPRPVWLLPEGDDPGRVAALVDLLLAQGIQVERSEGPVLAHDVLLHDRSLRDADRFPAGTWRLRLDQPRGRLLASLLEPDPALSHLYFYDVSAWSLAMAFGVAAHRAAGVDGSFTKVTRAPRPAAELPAQDGPRPYALAIPWHVGDGAQLLQRLHAANVPLFVLGAAVEIEGRSLPQGTALAFQSMVTEDLRATVRTAAAGLSCRVLALRTGLTDRGPDLGSSSVDRLFRPRIAVIDGTGVNASSAGAVWFLFERLLQVPVTRISTARANSTALEHFNVLVVPDGFSGSLDGSRLRAWLARGNVVVGIEGGAQALARALELKAAGEARGDAPPTAPATGSAPAERPWQTLRAEEEDRRRRSQPGAIVEVQLDPDSLLSAGYGARIPVLSSGERGFPLEGYGRVIGFYGDGVRLGGYLPQEAPRRSFAGSGYLNQVNVGRGAAVLFHQDPHFRLVWHGLTRLFLNACFLLPRHEAPPR